MDDNARFEQVTTDYLAYLYASQPVMATAMGIHDYDDQLPDLSRFSMADELRRTRAYLHEIDRLSLARMSPDNRLDYRLARADSQIRISRQEQERPLERQPHLYAETALFGLYLLAVRDFAPPEERALSLRGRLRALPKLFQNARENLSHPPRIFTELGIRTVEEGASLFLQTIPAFVEQVDSRALRQETLDACREGLQHLHAYGEYLKREILPQSDGDFALGREIFDYYLRVGHMLEESGDDLLEIGREEMARTQAQMTALSAQIDPSRSWQEQVAQIKRLHPPAETLVDCYRSEMERAREFVILKRLAELPEGESLIVRETPPFARASLPYAAYLPPAAFEARQEGVFWVTPVDGALPAEEREARLQGHSRFRIPVIAVHEGYPGHHLQLTRANQSPSRFRRHFGQSSLLIEGWALYCEEMMREQGYYSDPRVQLMQLKDQLWRACRVVLDVSLHTRRMRVEEAVRFLVEEAFLEEPHARAEVWRYAGSPTQPMTYLMGKRALMEIRGELERRQGARFDLRRFHNQILAFGSVQPRLIREAMIAP